MSYTYKEFKVLNYEYLNTGGNCMVGIFTMWIPDLRTTLYVLTNEEGCNLTTVDYISHEIMIDNYDDVIVDHCIFDELHESNMYFELYRYCLNKYTEDDCRHFGCTRHIPFYLLSNELQAKVDSRYRIWLESECLPVETNGIDIIVSPMYEPDDVPPAIRCEITTNYVPDEDVTIIWQHMYLGEEPIQRSLIGWYFGEPDDHATNTYTLQPYTAQFF